MCDATRAAADVAVVLLEVVGNVELPAVVDGAAAAVAVVEESML